METSRSEQDKYYSGGFNTSFISHYKAVFHLQVVYPLRLALLGQESEMLRKPAVLDEFERVYVPQQPMPAASLFKWGREDEAFSALIDCYEAFMNVLVDVSVLSEDSVWRRCCEVADVIAEVEKEHVQVQLTLLCMIEKMSSSDLNSDRRKVIETLSDRSTLTEQREEILEKCWIRTNNSFQEFKNLIEGEFSFVAIEKLMESQKSELLTSFRTANRWELNHLNFDEMYRDLFEHVSAQIKEILELAQEREESFLQGALLLAHSCYESRDTQGLEEQLNKIESCRRQDPPETSERLRKYREFVRSCQEQPSCAEKCFAFGPGLNGGYVGDPNKIIVQACDAEGRKRTSGGDHWEILVVGPSGAVASTYWDKKDGTYEVTFIPLEVGKHSISIAHKQFATNIPISASPWITYYATNKAIKACTAAVRSSLKEGESLIFANIGQHVLLLNKSKQQAYVSSESIVATSGFLRAEILGDYFDLGDVEDVLPLSDKHAVCILQSLLQKHDELSRVVFLLELKGETKVGKPDEHFLVLSSKTLLGQAAIPLHAQLTPESWSWSSLPCKSTWHPPAELEKELGEMRETVLGGWYDAHQEGAPHLPSRSGKQFVVRPRYESFSESVVLASINKEVFKDSILIFALLNYVQYADTWTVRKSVSRLQDKFVIFGGCDDHDVCLAGLKSLNKSESEMSLRTSRVEVKFERLRTRGKAPCRRADFAMCSHESFVFVSGGVDMSEKPLTDVFVLNSRTGDWFELLVLPRAERILSIFCFSEALYLLEAGQRELQAVELGHLLKTTSSSKMLGALAMKFDWLAETMEAQVSDLTVRERIPNLPKLLRASSTEVIDDALAEIGLTMDYLSNSLDGSTLEQLASRHNQVLSVKDAIVGMAMEAKQAVRAYAERLDSDKEFMTRQVNERE
eukprot:763418-Hanusia_phi.AAC.10